MYETQLEELEKTMKQWKDKNLNEIHNNQSLNKINDIEI